MQICLNCRDENDDYANFCKHCGARFAPPGMAVCPHQHIIDPTWSECPYCKIEQSLPAEYFRPKKPNVPCIVCGELHTCIECGEPLPNPRLHGTWIVYHCVSCRPDRCISCN